MFCEYNCKFRDVVLAVVVAVVIEVEAVVAVDVVAAAEEVAVDVDEVLVGRELEDVVDGLVPFFECSK